MIQITAACQAALKRPHTRTPVAEVYNGFQTLLASTYGSPRIYLEQTGGISVDRKAKHLRRLTATVIDRDGQLGPQLLRPTFDPLRRTQIQTYFDIGWTDPVTGADRTERIPSGRFIIARETGTEIGSGEQIDIVGDSRSSTLIQDNLWLNPYTVVPNVPYDAAIRLALTDRSYRNWVQQFRFETSVNDTPFGMTFGGDSRSDPWSDLQQMAVSDAKELYDDALGAFVLRTPPDPTRVSKVTWYYDESPSSTRLQSSTKRDIDMSNAYNGVVANVSAPWLVVPLLSIKWDDNPGSPTYYKGQFGKKAFQYDNPNVSSQSQLDDATLKKYNSIVGVMEQADFEGLVNPAHEPGDAVAIKSSGTGLEQDVVILEAFTLSFDVNSSMPVTIRRKRKI